MSQSHGWIDRSLANTLQRLLPTQTAELILRDLDEGYRRRLGDGPLATGARRWYRRQLFLALTPSRLIALRQLHREAMLARPHRYEPSGDIGASAMRLAGHFLFDMRYSLRLLTRSPWFSGLTVVVLAGGLGVAVFTYSMLNSMMFKPLPLLDGDRIVRVMGMRNGYTQLLDAFDLPTIRAGSESLEAIGVFQNRHMIMHGGSEPRAMFVTYAETNIFEYGEVRAQLGRGFVIGDGAPGAAPVAVLGHALWRAHFAADSEIVGREIELNGVPTRIVGVMPEGYGFPVSAEMWMPLPGADLRVYDRDRLYVNVYAKLRPGISEAVANAELNTLLRGFWLEDPDYLTDDARRTDGAAALSFPLSQMGDEAYLTFGMLNMVAGFILLLACINVGNLLISRALERGRETTIRVALGAPRFRLVAQMMGESVLVSLLGGVLALIGAGWGLGMLERFMHAMAPGGIPFWIDWRIDADTVAATAVLVAATILLVGVVPAWRATRADCDSVLREGTPGAPGRRSGRLNRALVVAQVALIAVLLFLGGMSTYVAWLMKHRAEARGAVIAIHEVLHELDPAVRPDQIVSLQELLGLVARMATTFAMVLLSCFGFALLMAITGIYGIAARSVTRRIHEIGVRRAVGATEHGIVRLFLRRGSRQLLIGLSLAAVIGAPASLAVHQFLQLNITAYIIGASVVPALIAVIVFAAIYIPTRRALRLEPSVALWRE